MKSDYMRKIQSTGAGAIELAGWGGGGVGLLPIFLTAEVRGHNTNL